MCGRRIARAVALALAVAACSRGSAPASSLTASAPDAALRAFPSDAALTASPADAAVAPVLSPGAAPAPGPGSDAALALAGGSDLARLAPSSTRAPAPDGEARRSTIARLGADVLLLPLMAPLREHFGDPAKGPFEVQHIDLADGRSGVLVTHADESDPIFLAFDRDEALWSKLRPAAGILPPVKHLTVLPRPEGGAVLFAWVTSLHMVAARMWADDGNPFGDFEIFAPDACDALSAAYGAGQGWIVTCTSPQGTRAQRLREDGAVAWGREGVAVGSTSASGPATVAFDTPASMMLFERVAAVGGDRILAFRYDPDAQPLWPNPADLGTDAGPSGRAASDRRVAARALGGGLVRVDRPLGVVGKGAARASEVSSTGVVQFR
jgi:hypothetical protein